MCCKSTKSFELPDLGPQREMWVNVSICPRTWRGLSWNLISSFNFLNCKELGSIVVGQPAEVQVLSHREQDEQLSVPQSSYFQLGIIIFLKRCSFKVDRFQNWLINQIDCISKHLSQGSCGSKPLGKEGDSSVSAGLF